MGPLPSHLALGPWDAVSDAEDMREGAPPPRRPDQTRVQIRHHGDSSQRLHRDHKPGFPDLPGSGGDEAGQVWQGRG